MVLRVVGVALCVASLAGAQVLRRDLPKDAAAATWQHGLDEALARPGPLSAAQVKAFFTDGFVVVEGLLDDETVKGLVGDVDDTQSEFAAELVDSGLLAGPADDWETAPWDERLSWIEGELPDGPVLFHKSGWLSPAFQALATDDRLVDVVRQLGVPAAPGGALGLHPFWNVQGKTKNQPSSAIPWHQDASYLEPRVRDRPMVGAWLPLTDATAANGCLAFVKGSHVSGKTVPHTCCSRETWFTETSLDACSAALDMDCAENVDLAPVAAGGAVFFGPTVLQTHVPNTSPKTRWAVDLRFHEAAGDRAPPAGKSGRPEDWFFGVKDSLVIRAGPGRNVTALDDDLVAWAAVDRNAMAEKVLDTKKRGGRVSPKDLYSLDPVVTGPWMHSWTLTHRNRHVDRYLRAQPRKVRDAVFDAEL